MENTAAQNFWRKCSTCKKPIGLGSSYYVCSVSTCNGQRTGYVFCSMQCFETHLPAARHRDAGAVERTAPKTPYDPAASTAEATRPPSRVFATQSTQGGAGGGPNLMRAAGANKLPREVLIVASRLKEYVTARSDYNTSQSVMDVLSDHIRVICDRAIDNARSEGRKTVMDRDFAFLKEF